MQKQFSTTFINFVRSVDYFHSYEFETRQFRFSLQGQLNADNVIISLHVQVPVKPLINNFKSSLNWIKIFKQYNDESHAIKSRATNKVRTSKGHVATLIV